LNSQIINWKKAEIESFGKKCEWADLIVSDDDKLLLGVQFDENLVFRYDNIAFDWFIGDIRSIDSNIEKILSINIVKNRLYILAKYNDGQQRLIKQTRLSDNNWSEFSMLFYPKFLKWGLSVC
jgi:hypothetical protein